MGWPIQTFGKGSPGEPGVAPDRDMVILKRGGAEVKASPAMEARSGEALCGKKAFMATRRSGDDVVPKMSPCSCY